LIKESGLFPPPSNDQKVGSNCINFVSDECFNLLEESSKYSGAQVLSYSAFTRRGVLGITKNGLDGPIPKMSALNLQIILTIANVTSSELFKFEHVCVT
jgi:hypothetical protein